MFIFFAVVIFVHLPPGDSTSFGRRFGLGNPAFALSRSDKAQPNPRSRRSREISGTTLEGGRGLQWLVLPFVWEGADTTFSTHFLCSRAVLAGSPLSTRKTGERGSQKTDGRHTTFAVSKACHGEEMKMEDGQSSSFLV